MSAATAEIIRGHTQPHLHEAVVPTIVRADLLERDGEIKRSTDQFIGQVGTSQEVEVQFVTEVITHDSLLDSVKQLKEGNEAVRPSVRANVRPAVIEAIYKAAHVIEIKSSLDENGLPIQHGQTHRSVQKNSLRYASKTPAMKEMVEAEVLNNFRIEDYIADGTLEGSWLLVPSLFTDAMTTEEARDNGFFTQDMTGIYQATTIIDGELVTQSAFVAGVAESLGEDDEVLGLPRPDKEAIAEVYKDLELDLEDGFTTTGLIKKPLIIPKEFMPDGIIDFVKVVDEKRGGTFFGQNKPVQDYKEHLKVCAEREKNLEATIDLIIAEFVESADLLLVPSDAIDMLYELTKKHVLKRSVEDTTIDISIFGSGAVAKLEQAREFYERGELDAMNKALDQANDLAIFAMCGIGRSKDQEEKLESKNPVENVDPFDEEKESKTGKIKCFRCKKVVDKKDVVKEDTWCCPKCHYEVDICDGTVVNEGDELVEDRDEEATVYHLEDIFRQKQEDNKQHEE